MNAICRGGMALVSVMVFVLIGTSSSSAESEKQPNVMVVIVDDMGFSDLGCYGGEIETPNLNQLAANGLRFTQFYNTARCWPTRSALLTGFYAQQVRRDALPGIEKSGNRGTRPDWAPLLPAMLKPLGYRSYHSGKWHLDGMPIANGFDQSYLLKDQGRFFNPKVHWKDDKKLPEVESGSGYYGTTAIADHAITCLKDHAQSHTDEPFFHYLAFTAPHFPLHALPEDIDKYRNRYQDGWEKLRTERYQRIQKSALLNVKLSSVERELGPPYHFPNAFKILGEGEVNRPIPWNELTQQQQEFQAMKMALHAAMVDRVDQELGRVLDQLRSMDAMEDTLIMFLSDNGASAEIMVRSDGHDPTAAPGSAASYLCLGPGWSTVCNTPFRRHKTWVHEGGISTPLIVHWPKRIKDRGTLRTNPGHVIDIAATIFDAAGGEHPQQWNGTPVPSPPGKSLLPVILEGKTVEHKELWWLHEGHRALRRGDWKIVAAKGEPWELYNLKNDRTEQQDLANQLPPIMESMVKRWETMAEEFAAQLDE